MAIQFNASALDKFRGVDFGRGDAIANLGGDNGLVQHGNRGLGVFAKIRFSSTKANNNAVRTELLKALGRAFDLQGVGEQGGRTTFSREFMDRLEEILGPAFKRGDFGIDANGAVKSGKPLTQRRIQAVCNAVDDYVRRQNDLLKQLESPNDNLIIERDDDNIQPIVGWVKIPVDSDIESTNDNAERLRLLQNDENVVIQFNPEYRP